MTAVTPVGIQNTLCLILSRIATHPCNVFVAVFHQIHPLIPSAYTGTEILPCTRFCHHLRFVLSLLGRIPPRQADRFFWQLPDQFRLCTNNITPEHWLFTLGYQKFAELFNIVNIQTVNTLFLCHCFRFSFSEVKCLVRTDIKFVRCKKCHIFLDHRFDLLDGFSAGDIHCVMLHPVPEGKWLFPAVRKFTELTAALRRKQHIEMAEGCNGRYQFNMKLGTVGIQLADLLCRKRCLVTPHLGKSRKQIGMLHIKL